MPDLAIAPLRAVVETDLAMRIQLEDAIVTRLPNGEEEITGWALHAEQDGLLTIVSVAQADIAAARGARAQWFGKLALSEPVVSGQRAIVRGRTDDAAWQLLIEITADLGLTKRLSRQFTAVDVDVS